MKLLNVLLFISLLQTSFAQIENINFKGNGVTAYDGWENLNMGNFPSGLYGSFPGLQQWAYPISANKPKSKGSTLNKIANGTQGGPYPAFDSLYFGGVSTVPNTFGGTLEIDVDHLSNLKCLVFQIILGEVYGLDFYQPTGTPKLLINTNTVILPSYVTLINRVENPDGPSTNPEEQPVYINTYAYQWDLGNFQNTINSLKIEFSCVQHVQIYEMRLDQTTFIQNGNVLMPNTNKPSLRVLSTGQPSFNGTRTTVTHHFVSEPNQYHHIEYTHDLKSNWDSADYHHTTDDGIFHVTFNKEGNHEDLWSKKMFFRIRYN